MSFAALQPTGPGQRCRSTDTDYSGEVITDELVEEGCRYRNAAGLVRRAGRDIWICWHPGVVGPYRVIIAPEHLEVIQ
ncbi:hypothetical protein GY26_16155 [Gammaproteobacteria bacterium MFB021]|nr:hypothetical protein GY26_16155 [Gammaproteobacteria bacterium MFB021]